jgi:hypothetical protein
MKYRLPIFVIALIAALVSCKKDANYSIAGKWQEVKMTTYNQDLTTGAISGDTTYKAATFGIYDYAQFNNDGICVISETGWIGTAAQVIKVQEIQNYTYTKSAESFLLKPAHTDPYIISGVSTDYTASRVSANTVVLHAVTSYLNPSVRYKTITDSYYNK